MQAYRLFFVLGVPKSGTTWLQLLLNAHPNIECKGEGGLLVLARQLQAAASNYNNTLTSRPFVKNPVQPIDKAELEALIASAFRQRLSMQAPAEGKKVEWFGDKDPGHMAQIERMCRVFPTAAFIHIIRDGRDGWVSWRSHVQQPGRGSMENFTPEGARKIGAAWSGPIRKVRAACANSHVRYQELRYEDLLADAHRTFGEVLSVLGAPNDSDIVQRCLAETNFVKLSGGRNPGDEDKNSFFRKGVRGDWKNYLSPELSAIFCEAADGLMEELGYSN